MDVSVALVKAYLELCGYFVLAELPVRAADAHGYHDVTDLDVIAVRFAHTPRVPSRRVDRPLEIFLSVDPALESAAEGIEVLIGEVKEGRARLNPGLRRIDTVALALRRVGCCSAEAVESHAARLAARGELELKMPNGTRCLLRVVAFAGIGAVEHPKVLTVSLGHCAEFIASWLRTNEDVLAGVHFGDSVLGLFAVQHKSQRGSVAEDTTIRQPQLVR